MSMILKPESRVVLAVTRLSHLGAGEQHKQGRRANVGVYHMDQPNTINASLRKRLYVDC